VFLRIRRISIPDLLREDGLLPIGRNVRRASPSIRRVSAPGPERYLSGIPRYYPPPSAPIEWLTGYDDAELHGHLEADATFEEFFAGARLNPNVSLITGVVCGVRVEDVEDPLMQKIRYLDKLVDELAKGKAMEKVLRT
jgi:hypothetical protein